MTEAPKDLPFSKTSEAAEGMDLLTHTAVAIFMSETVENILTDNIMSKMVFPSNNFRERLFGGYGPLRTFNAKIDIARALEIIDEETYNTLRILKGIRNAFAHPKSPLPDFYDEAVVKECRKLPGYADDEDCFSLFVDVVASIIIRIEDSEDVKAISELIREIGRRVKTFSKISP